MLRELALLALAVSSADAMCNKEYDSTDLSSAVDAALMELQGTSGWFYETFGHDYSQINSCTSDPSKWDYPAASTATGLLRRVLDSGEIKVAGTPWSAGANNYCAPDATSCFGSAANGVQNPTGYWVDMLNDVADKMSANYGKTITIKRVYYDNSDLVNNAVANKPEEVDMSEPYYYLGGFLNDQPRFEHFHFSCVTAAASSEFFARKSSGIRSTGDLVRYILAATNPSGRTVGFIGAGNYDAVSSILPSNVIANADLGEFDDIVSGVGDGTFIAGYRSEGVPLNTSLFEIFETGIVSPRAILYRLDEECVCEASVANYTAPAVKCDNSSDSMILIALIVVSSVALLVTILLAIVILRERQQKPMFMPLLSPASGGGEVAIETGKA